MNLTLNYNDTKAFVDALGIKRFVEMMETNHAGDFFSCSTGWLDNQKYICKLKGGKMDLLINWE